ncbi:hypothetical protein KC336_g7943 [Hortaea werneckii]|nr:hypothetical protein KC336_g7943 [Hortaea werneckii]
MNRPDERLVYLSFKNIFTGPDAHLRSLKTIRKRVQKYKDKEEIKALIQQHNLDHICNTAKSLLESEVFESTLKAKIRFPEVFDVSPSQSADREASEAEAAKSEADAIRKAVEGRIAHTEPSAVIEEHPPGPRTVEGPGWDCAESVELNIWSSVFRLRKETFSPDSLAEMGKPLPQVLDSMAQLRHTAVHRIRVAVNRVHQYLLDAERLMILLDNETTSKQLAELRQKAELATEDMRTNKDLLETRAAKQLRRYADQIVELERPQQSAIEEMLNEDKTCQLSAAALLESAVGQDPRHALDIYYGNSCKVPEGPFDDESSSDAEEHPVGDLRRSNAVVDEGAS